MICTLSTTLHRLTQKHLCWHSITKILRNGPRAHFPFRRPNLASVGWCTGQSGAPPDSHCRCPMRDLLPFLAHPTVGPQGRLAHRTVSGAHWIVWCAQPTVVVGHASLADHAADRWCWRPLAHRTVRCTTGRSSEL
jgi:hypothetical protein